METHGIIDRRGKDMKLAILGLGNIANRVAKGIQVASNAELYAVASTSLQRAQAFAQTHGVSVYYDSYEKMLQDESVQVVYLCTPNHLHFEQIMMCFAHGKHVICEKPMVATAPMVEALYKEARKCGCFLMEAHKTVFTPLNVLLKKRIDEGAIGRVLRIKAEYCYSILEEQLPHDHWAFDATCGGSSYDVGVYPICFANYFAASAIAKVDGVSSAYKSYECDFMMDAIITYDNGVQANVSSSWLYASEQKGYGYIIGEEGYIVVPAYWKATRATLVKNGVSESITVMMESDFSGEIEHAVTCIQNGLLESDVLGEKQSVAIVKVVEHCNEYRKKRNAL